MIFVKIANYEIYLQFNNNLFNNNGFYNFKLNIKQVTKN